jgi:hypothetical protein
MKRHLSIVRALRSSIAIFAAFAALSSCEEPLEPVAARQFVIWEGEHYASPRLFERFETQTLSFRATFDESAMYAIEDPAMQADKNKLMGFSDCNCSFQKNSASIAWQWNNSQLEIYAYSYVDSVRIEKFLSYVNLNEENLYEITATGGEYVFYLNGERRTAIPRTSNCSEGVNHIVYPYFGGPVPAPHNVTIEIEMVK